MGEQLVVYAVSDRSAETVTRLVRGASAQFRAGHVRIKVLSNVSSARQVADFIERAGDDQGLCAVFHTMLSRNMREDLRRCLQTLRIHSVDLLGSAAHVMADLLGEGPEERPGLTIEDGAVPERFDLAQV